MKKATTHSRLAAAFLFLALFSAAIPSFARKAKKTAAPPADSVLTGEQALQAVRDSLDRFDKAIPYRQGQVDIKDIVTLNVPPGYKFIPEAQAKTIVTDFWQNPADNTIVGMLVPDRFKLADMNGWAFVVSYDEVGYVKDEDAKDIDYDEMLKAIQADEKTVNQERVAQGYPAIHVLDWATKPYYDNERKILHWAKKIQFGDDTAAAGDLTLNYDVRVLGRKGVLSMNAVGTMGQLPEINGHIGDVLAVATFKSGYAYKDFNPGADKVAAYTVGGLIAGKLLAKTGLFVLLLKNIKLVLFAIIGFFGAFRKKIAGLFRRRRPEDDLYEYAVAPLPDETPADEALPGNDVLPPSAVEGDTRQSPASKDSTE